MSDDDSIGDKVLEWRAVSKKNFRSDQLRRLISDAKSGKKPSEYKPEDFIPRIPKELKAKYTQEKDESSDLSNLSRSLSQSSISEKENSSSRNVKKASKNPLSNRYSLNSPIVVLSDLNNRNHSRREKSKLHEDDDTQVSQLGPLNKFNGAASSPRFESLISESAKKRLRPNQSLERIQRLVNDSKANKKPSEYDPNDFIPKSAQKAKKALALQEAKIKRLEMEQELARIEQANMELKQLEEIEKKTANKTRHSRKSDHMINTSKRSNQVEGNEASGDENYQISIPDSQDAPSPIRTNMTRSINRTKVIKNTQPEPIQPETEEEEGDEDELLLEPEQTLNVYHSTMNRTKFLNQHGHNNSQSPLGLSPVNNRTLNKTKNSTKRKSQIKGSSPNQDSNEEEEEEAENHKTITKSKHRSRIQGSSSPVINRTKVIKSPQDSENEQEEIKKTSKSHRSHVQSSPSPVNNRNSTIKNKSINRTKLIKETQDFNNEEDTLKSHRSRSQNSSMLSLSPVVNKTTNKTKNKSINRTKVIKEPQEEEEIQKTIAKSNHRSRIQSSSSSPVINRTKNKSVNRTRVVKETQDSENEEEIPKTISRSHRSRIESSSSPINNRTTNKTRSIHKIYPVADMTHEKLNNTRKNRKKSSTSKLNDSRDPSYESPPPKSIQTSKKTADESKNQTRKSTIRIKLPDTSPETLDSSRINMRETLVATTKQATKKLSTDVPITPILSKRQSEGHINDKMHTVIQEEEEAHQFNDSNFNDRTNKNMTKLSKRQKSEKYKMSSTANTSQQFQLTFNNETELAANSPLDTHNRKSYARGASKSKHTFLNELDEEEPMQNNDKEQQMQVSPAKMAFETSLRKSLHQKSKLDAPPPLNIEDNDEIIIGSEGILDNLVVSPPTAEAPSSTADNKQAKAKSSIVITKVPELSVKPINNRRLSVAIEHASKDQTMVNEDDEMELLAVQSNQYLKRSFAKSINSTRNSTLSTNQSLKSNPFVVPKIPRPPTLSSSPPQKKEDSKKSKSIKQKTKEPEPEPKIEPTNELHYEETIGSMFTHDEPINNSETDNHMTHPIATELGTNEQQNEHETDHEMSRSPSPTISNKATKKKAAKQKKQRKLEKEKKEKKRVKQTKHQRDVSKNSSSSSNSSNEQSANESLINRPTQSKKRDNSLDRRRKTLYSVKDLNLEHDDDGLRRSKRVKLDHYSKAVYKYEKVKDFTGKTIMVQTLAGITKNNYPSKYAELMAHTNVNNNLKSKSQPKLKKTKKHSHRIEDNNDENDIGDDFVKHEPVLATRNTQDSTLDISDINLEEDQVNKSTEVVIFENSSQKEENDDENESKRNVFCFKRQLLNKKYENCYPGVALHIISTTSGILCINQSMCTKTQMHTSDVLYFVQKGGPLILSLNGNLSRHQVGDSIKIPNDVQYKIKSISDKEKSFLYFEFL